MSAAVKRQRRRMRVNFLWHDTFCWGSRRRAWPALIGTEQASSGQWLRAILQAKARHQSGCLAPPSIRVGVVSITVHQILYSLGAGPRGTYAPSEDRLAQGEPG